MHLESPRRTWGERLGKGALSPLITALLGGCGHQPYEPAGHLLQRQVAPAELPPVGQGREIVVAPSFRDRRPYPDRCGERKFDTDSPRVEDQECPEPDMGAWAAELTASTLERARFSVVTEPEQVKSSDPLYLDGQLEQLFVEQIDFGAVEADFAVRFWARRRSGLIAERVFFAKGSHSESWGRQDLLQQAFDDASNQLMFEVVEAVSELMEQHPSPDEAPSPAQGVE